MGQAPEEFASLNYVGVYLPINMLYDWYLSSLVFTRYFVNDYAFPN